MSITLRIAIPQVDFPQLAELLSIEEPQPMTAEMLHESDRCHIPGQYRRRLVARDETSRIIGYSLVQHDPWIQQGRYFLTVKIAPNRRNQGIGAMIYAEALQLAVEKGATELVTEVREESTVSLAFAEKRGFKINQHIFESRLDLATFNEGRFGCLIDSVMATGICFFSLADAGNTPEARRKLYDINARTAGDNPFPPYEEFQKIVFEAFWFRPEGQILAADGDCFVGLSALGYFRETNSMHQTMTGVDSAYRGRKIAQALKLLAIQYAKRCGVIYISTTNDSQNAPMLAINRKLGYQPLPGFYIMINNLTNGTHI